MVIKGVRRVQSIIRRVCPTPVRSPPSLRRSNCGPTDNANDCNALLAAYAAWGNQPTLWLDS